MLWLAAGGARRDHGGMSAEEWSTAEHALGYLSRADTLPHRTEGEGVLLEQVPKEARRVLDLGTGDGRLLALLRIDRHEMLGVGLDISEPMLGKAHERLAGDARVQLVKHDLAKPLPVLCRFDAVVSSFAIHHLEHERKRSLYAEVFELLEPGGAFCNLEHVASPTERLHWCFYDALGYEPGWEDSSNRLLEVEPQLGWLRELGFDDVDCYWKWLEMALLVGVKPAA
jgi:tRNA (cmo5U34)-methyltransferase